MEWRRVRRRESRRADFFKVVKIQVSCVESAGRWRRRIKGLVGLWALMLYSVLAALMDRECSMSVLLG